jgi:hypothetical protein
VVRTHVAGLRRVAGRGLRSWETAMPVLSAGVVSDRAREVRPPAVGLPAVVRLSPSNPKGPPYIMSDIRRAAALLLFLGRCCRAVKQSSGRGATRPVPNASGGPRPRDPSSPPNPPRGRGAADSHGTRHRGSPRMPGRASPRGACLSRDHTAQTRFLRHLWACACPCLPGLCGLLPCRQLHRSPPAMPFPAIDPRASTQPAAGLSARLTAPRQP